MKITNALKTGFKRSARSWKAALIISLALLVLISLFTIPFNTVLKSSFGSSAVTDELIGDINFDIISDLSGNLKNFSSYFSSGIFLIVFAGVIVFTFFSGGLFNSLKPDSGKFSVNEFFRASAGYFWPFLGITLIAGLLIGFISFFLAGIIIAILFAGNELSDSAAGLTGIVSGVILAGVISVLFLVADYSRANYSSGRNRRVFKSLGYGFNMTFSGFSSSVAVMFILILIQGLFVWLMSMLVLYWKPVTGFEVFLMLLTLQFLFFVRIFLRMWRYASVIALMKMLEEKADGTTATGEREIVLNENNPGTL